MPPELRWVSGLRGMLIAVGLLLSLWALLLTFAGWAGRVGAKVAASQLHDSLQAVVYSEKRLALNAPEVRELSAADTTETYKFIYGGLIMLWRGNDKYFFLPATWERSQGGFHCARHGQCAGRFQE